MRAMTRTEYGHRKDCRANGCPVPCPDEAHVIAWVITGRPAPVDRTDDGLHAMCWVQRTITVTEWEPVP